MEFLNIETLSSAYKFALKIEDKFKQKGRRDNFATIKWKAESSKTAGKQMTKESISTSPMKKMWGVKKIQQDSGMWCEVHKTLIIQKIVEL